ncbi:MAG: hypothetical protein ABFD90_03980 [Phycisphaerales bacterium]
MEELKTARHNSIASIVSILVLAHMPPAATHGGQENVGELRIEGQGIEQLVLTDAQGQQRTFDNPGPVVTLPSGEYSVQSITLQGGHSCSYSQIPDNLRIVTDANAPATLKAGAPLQQVIKAERKGSVLILNYELVGQGGERYAISRNQDSGTPMFTVYRGDRKVASGEFEFG